MSNSNTHWIALAAIAISLAVLVPVVVGHPAAGTPMYGDGPSPTSGDHAHESTSSDTADHHADVNQPGEQNHHVRGSQHGEETHHADHAQHGQVGHEHAADTGHDHQDIVGNETRVSGDDHHDVNSSVDQTTTSGQVDRQSGWGGCH